MTVRRFHAEVATAIVTGAVGVTAVIGAEELGHGWTSSGPQSGYFPFYVGLILIAASLWNLGAAVARHRIGGRLARVTGDVEEPFLDAEKARRIGGFLAVMVAFLAITLVMGIYVGAIFYISWTAWRQGGYRWPLALAFGAGFAVALYLVFEVIFLVPLLKGPIEPLLGIY